MQISKSIDKSIIDMGKFMVNISDGGLNIVDALHNSVKAEVSEEKKTAIIEDNNISTIIEKVIKDGYSASQISSIRDYFIDASDNIAKLIEGDFASVGFSNSFDDNMFEIGNNNNQPILISDLISGHVTFKDASNNIITIPTDANIRVVPSRFQNDANGWNGLNCNIAVDGNFGTQCWTDDNEQGVRDAFNDSNETFQVVVYKNSLNPTENHWDEYEDVYKYIGHDDNNLSVISDIIVLTSDYQDRSNDNNSTTTQSQKNMADGYIIKLPSPAIAECPSSIITSPATYDDYNSSMSLGEKGTRTFSNSWRGKFNNITISHVFL